MSSKDDDLKNIEESVQETAEEHTAEPVQQIAAESADELDLFTSTTAGPVYSIPNVQTEKSMMGLRSINNNQKRS